MPDFSKFFQKTTTQAQPSEPIQPKKTQLPKADLAILKQAKSRGYDAQGAFKELKNIKSKYGSSEKFFEEMEGRGMSGLPGLAIGAGKGALSTLEGGMQLAKEGLHKIGLQTASEAGGVAPPGGEIIPEAMRTPKGTTEKIGFTAEQLGEFVVPASGISKLSKAATGTKFLSGGGKLAAAGRVAAPLGIESAAYATQAGVQRGEFRPMEDLSTALVAGGLVRGIGGIAKIVKGGKINESLARLGGASDETIEAIKNKSVGQKILNNLPSAKEAMKNPAELASPFMQVGEKTLKPSVKILTNNTRKLGKKISEVLNTSKATITTKDALSGFNTMVKNLGGKVTKKGLVFPEFSRIQSATDTTKLNEIFSILNTYKNKPVPANKIFALRQHIDDFINYSKQGRVLDPITPVAELPLKEARLKLQESLVATVPETGPMFRQFSEQRKITDFFNRKLGEEASSASVLKGVFSPLAKSKLAPRLKELGKKSGKDIIAEARAAKAAMDIVGDPRAQSLLNAVQRPSKAGILQAALRKITNPEKRLTTLFNALHKKAPKEGSKEMGYLLMTLIANGWGGVFSD